MLFDLPLDQLQSYRPDRREPPDFGAFWTRTITESDARHAPAIWDPVDAGLPLVRSFDGTFAGYMGQPVRAWLNLPAKAAGPLPCIVEYIGYGGGRGFPHDWLLWSSAGYAHVIMDTRGQGSLWSPGHTPDPEGSDPHVPGFLTRGILDPESYYYRRVFADAVRCVAAARSHPEVDPQRVFVTGGSQGGGIALAAAGLVRDLAGVMPDVPFLCHFRVAAEITDRDPYREIGQYCMIHRDHVGRVFSTLDYFDGVNFAAHASAPSLFSVGLMDDICPPRTVFAAYNHYAGPKTMEIYRFNHHEGGGSHHVVRKLRFVRAILDGKDFR